MKKMLVLAVLACAALLMTGQAFAADSGVTLDASLIYATEPAGAFDDTIGIGVGAVIDMSSRFKSSSKDMKVGIRGDLSYFDWEGSYFGIDVSYWRLVIFGGPRITFSPGGRTNIAPYVEGGLELAHGEAEVATFFGKASATETDLGIAGGGGVDFLLTKNLKLGVSGRLHIISDDFITLAVTLGTMF